MGGLGNASGHQFGYPALSQWGQNRKSQSGLGGQSESERLSVTTPHHCGWVSLWVIHTVGIVVLWVSVGVYTHNVGVQQVRWLSVMVLGLCGHQMNMFRSSVTL